jgi:transcriptional regulator with XRE-family HTH domain
MDDEFWALVVGHVGGRIRRRRRALDLSQEALAEAAGLHRTQISLFERGERMPRVDTLILLARGLGVAEVQLLAGIDEDAIERRVRRRQGDTGPHGAEHG